MLIIRPRRKMSFYNPYAKTKSNAYKVQLHTHTTNSDGAQSPVDLMTAYKNSGCDACAITDHNIITADPIVSGITHIIGCEETASGGHIPCYYLSARETSPNDQTVINTINGQGGFVSFAHPDYSGGIWTYAEMAALTGVNLIEVYNAVVEETMSDDGYVEDKWDDLLNGLTYPLNKYFGLAVDDCHNTNDNTQFNRGWIIVYADAIIGIKASIQAGNFYATQGPDVMITTNGHTINASTSNASTIAFIANDVIVQSTASVMSASYDIQGIDKYVRVKITRDTDGKMAWSNPIFLGI